MIDIVKSQLFIDAVLDSGEDIPRPYATLSLSHTPNVFKKKNIWKNMYKFI